MEEKIGKIQTEYSDKISKANSSKELDEIFLALFGKSGEISLLPKEFKNLSKDELRIISPLFNKVKEELGKAVNDKRSDIREGFYKKLKDEKLDLSETKIKERKGHLHPITQFENKIVELFTKLGFQQYDAPHIDTDYNVYEVLNIPKDSPARDLQDTLYIDTKKTKDGDYYILRGHTSNSEVRFMKQYKPPHRMILLGRCFRRENLDPRHEHTFEQFEIIYLDKGVSMANLQYLSEYFLKAVFGEEIKARLRPKYYPQVEPGGGIDALCIFCKGKARLPDGQGCKVCGGIGWLEIGGCGMIHPVAITNGGLDPEIYSGLAWGISPERMAMLIYGVEDIRLFKSGDLKFLERF